MVRQITVCSLFFSKILIISKENSTLYLDIMVRIQSCFVLFSQLLFSYFQALWAICIFENIKNPAPADSTHNPPYFQTQFYNHDRRKNSKWKIKIPFRIYICIFSNQYYGPIVPLLISYWSNQKIDYLSLIFRLNQQCG